MDKQGGFGRDIAMDLGTTSVLVAVRGKGVLLQEPAVVAVDRRTGQVLQVGQAARQMLGRTPGDLVAVRPLRDGLIDHCTVAEAMVRAFLQKAAPGRLLKPRLLIGVPSGISEVAERAVVEAGCVKGVITESKSGREVILAHTVIDATGDGDAAAAAGAEFVLGRPEDNVCQPVTLMFRIGGVDHERAAFPGSFESRIDLPKGEIQTLGHEHLPFPAGHVLLYPAPLPGEVCVNMTNVIGIDGTSVRDLTRAEIVCREQMVRIIRFLREFVPGYENCYAVTSASNVGVRETRHFKALYELTEFDIVEAKLFDDWIATRNLFNFDIHSLKGPGLDEHGAQHKFRSKGKYSIPFRCCIPQKLDGLLLSGRNIDGTHKAHSNFRVMPICLNIGQGVGTAAALAARHKIAARDVDVREVQKLLMQAGIQP